jgi:hypothetical protein
MNQYRCETCKLQYQLCPLDDLEISPNLHIISLKTINLVGCASHSDFQNQGEKVVFTGEPALTEIEIALRKEECPSENVQWAIERINRLQKELENSSHPYQSGRDTISKELALELCIDARKDVRDKVLDDFACWIKTEWVQESIKDYKADKPCK